MLPPARRDDGAVNVVVETPRGSFAKFKHDEETGLFVLSRALPTGVTYPYDWGIVPSTRGPDGDPLDVMLLWDCTSYPGILVPSRLIGVLKAEQTNPATGQRQRNDRLFALPLKAPRLNHVQTILELPDRIRIELEQFFLNVVAFEGKDLTLLGFGGASDAEDLLRKSLA
jgi:inorganic pyrophosphatase